MATMKSLAKMLAEKAREKPPEQDFLHMLEEAIVRLDREADRKPSKSFKPSSLGGCLRNVFYQVSGVDPESSDKTASSVGISESGSARHEHMQEAMLQMKRLGYAFEYIDVEDYLKKRPQQGTRVISKQGAETKLFNDILNLSFLCDGIILLRGRYYVIEIKTEVTPKYYTRSAPEDQHITQASCYSATLGIDQVIFIYENRDFCTKKPYLHIVTEDEKFNRVIAPIETVNTHIELNTTPEMTDKKKLCLYCNYKSRCKKDGK
jgi:CRISPR/Cas system-associated exonuclease Cas4 (RecB family)